MESTPKLTFDDHPGMRILLCTPATSTLSEKRFSYDGLTVSGLIVRLKPDLVCDLILVQNTTAANEYKIEFQTFQRLKETKLMEEDTFASGVVH